MVLCFFLFVKNTYAQPCVSSFPYNEDFETSNGSWVPAGTASDWAWGTPAKPVITGAAGGNKCWITGGLTASSYNLSERSTLTSPCFNFSTLVYPRIDFQIFWETERKYDGAKLQYSTDGGTVWNDIGSTATAANSCISQNWYNNSSINYLSATAGWSGNIQGNSGSCLGGQGSGAWLHAWHDLKFLAGQANVRFRFDFGAGSSCNAYDGFAIDDVSIGEWPQNTASFSYVCKPARTIDFTATTSCANGYSWNFGDPASGAANIDNTPNPSHTFSAPGSYTVLLTANFQGGPPATTTQTVTVIDANIQVTHPISCAGNDGSLLVNVLGSNGPFTYQWNTNPVQTTASATNLTAGAYSVIISGSNMCSTIASSTLTAPAQLTINVNTVNASCGNNNGSISANVNGGTGSYTYLWSTGATTSAITNLPPGSYSLHVVDGSGCSKDTVGIIISNINTPLSLQVIATNPQCNKNNGAISATVSGGMPAYQFTWNNGMAGPSINSLAPGVYNLHITDGSGCSKDSTGIVLRNINTPFSINLGKDTTLCTGQTLRLVPGYFADYLWQDNSTNADYLVASPGVYAVVVTNALGCTSRDEIVVSYTDCKDIYFPNAFTPNNDGLNDGFGPLGGAVNLLKDYRLNIYNRYGQLVYSTAIPQNKWNGKFNANKSDTQVFVWYASFSLLGKTETRKGTVLLIN